MKIRGGFAQNLKALGQQHLQFIESELTKRAITIKSKNVKHTLKFSGCWQVSFKGQDFILKLSPTGTALTINQPTGNLWYNSANATTTDFDVLIQKLTALIK